jgi:hypothetical protein
MSINIYALYVKTPKANDVKKFLSYWLSQTQGELPTIQNDQDSVFDFFKNEVPAYFAVSQHKEGWISILHDSYEPQLDLANLLSAEFNSAVIQAIGQSTVDTYMVSVHQGGELIRKLHSGEDTEGFEQEGSPFPFEKEILARVDDETHFFDYDDMQEFCKNFGIDLLGEETQNDRHWTVMKISEKAAPKKDSFLKALTRKLRGK